MDKQLLIKAGQSAYGDNWQTPLANDLDVNARSIRYWVSGERQPPNLQNELITILQNRIAQIQESIKMLNESKNTYFAVCGQDIIWGTGLTKSDAIADANQWVNQEKDPEKPSLSELLESSQGHRYGDGWSVLPCTKAIFDEVAIHGGQIGFVIEDDTIMLEGE